MKTTTETDARASGDTATVAELNELRRSLVTLFATMKQVLGRVEKLERIVVERESAT